MALNAKSEGGDSMTKTVGSTAPMASSRPGAVIHDMTKRKLVAKEAAMDKRGGKPTAAELNLEKRIGE